MTKYLGQQVQLATEHGPRTGLVVDIWNEASYVVMTKGIFPHKWELHMCNPSELRNIMEFDYEEAFRWYRIYRTGTVYGMTPLRAYLSENQMVVRHSAAPVKPVVPIDSLHTRDPPMHGLHPA